jgi:ATP-dependent Clp protease ATP-binding subunit ClpA
MTGTVRDVIVNAKREVERLHHGRIGTEHLLLALLDERAGIAHAVLHGVGLDRARVLAALDRLVGTPDGVLGAGDAQALEMIGIALDVVLGTIEESFGAGALQPAAEAPEAAPARRRPSWLRFSPRARRVWELSIREAAALGRRSPAPEHILLGILDEGGGLAVRILADEGLAVDEVRAATLAALARAA